MHDLFIARLHSDEKTDTAGRAHLFQQGIAETIDSRLAHPFKSPPGSNNEVAEPDDTPLVKREGCITKIDLGDTLPLNHVFQLGNDTLWRLRSPFHALNQRVRTIVPAGIGTAPARL